jgi:hypothetical protein
MIRPRPSSALLCAFVLVPVVQAQDNSASPWLIDRTLSVSPQRAPVPALKVRLLPPRWELKEGNAVPIYLRLVHEQNDAARKYWTETPKPWNLLPVDKIPLDEARKFLQDHHRFLRQFELGARRRTAEWNYTLDEGNPVGILLPDMQAIRTYAPMMLLQVRVALAEGNLPAAAHHLETGFAFSRHVADGPFLINSLVGIALAAQFTTAVADFIERPDAPNLYWALAALPHPLVDLRDNLDQEFRFLEWQIPELDDLDRERTAEQWDGVLRRVRTELRQLARGPDESKYFVKDSAPGDAAAKSPELPTARTYVARTHGWPADKVAAMPPAQVLLLYMVGTHHEDRDDWQRASYLPYPQAWKMFEASFKRLRDAPMTEGHLASHLVLPGLNKAMTGQVRMECNLTALRVVETLRMYAAAHDGKLPDKLDDVTEVPVPNDPATGRPFAYHREGDTATLVTHIPGDPAPRNGVRYRVIIRKQ